MKKYIDLNEAQKKQADLVLATVYRGALLNKIAASKKERTSTRFVASKGKIEWMLHGEKRKYAYGCQDILSKKLNE